MRMINQASAWGHRARLAALAVGVLALAGCATGYSFVQPDVAGSGAYYTGNGPYAGAGYYGYYGAGLYSDPYGGYGPYYGSSISFSLGFGDPWGWPGYAGFYGGSFFGGWPYYTGFGYPVYGFGGYGLRGYRRAHYRGSHHDGHGHYHDGRHNRTGMSGRHGPGDPRGGWFAPDSGPVGQAVNARALGPASFAPQDFVRAPVDRARPGRFIGMQQESEPDAQPAPGRAYADGRVMHMPSAVAMPPDFSARSEPAFRSDMPRISAMPAMPRTFHAMPQPAFRAAPMHFAAPAPMRSGGDHATRNR